MLQNACAQMATINNGRLKKGKSRPHVVVWQKDAG